MSGVNPKDPLRLDRPADERALFESVTRLTNGFSHDAVRSAMANVIVNSFRQEKTTRRDAERAWDEFAAKVKGLLLDQHYDANGRRRGIFPFNQTVVMGLPSNAKKYGR